MNSRQSFPSNPSLSLHKYGGLDLARSLSMAFALGISFLPVTGIAAPSAPSDPPSAEKASAPAAPALPQPAKALQMLMEGNQRFVSEKMTHPDQTAARREAVAKGQAPFAIILTCSDSRVAPELYFDQGLGDLFVIRDAGNVINPHVLGSMEYAVEHLHAPLIVVVGHERCGAVAAAVAGGHAEGNVGAIVESIAPAVEAAKGQKGDKVDNTVTTHAQMTAASLAVESKVLAKAIEDGRLLVYSGRYDLDSGRVEFLPELPASVALQPQKPMATKLSKTTTESKPKH